MVVSSSSCIHLPIHYTKRSCLSRNPHVNIPQRFVLLANSVVVILGHMKSQCLFFCRKLVGTCNITWRPPELARRRCVSTSLNVGECSFKCACLASLGEFDAVAGSGWVPIGDQVLLMASVFLTYMIVRQGNEP